MSNRALALMGPRSRCPLGHVGAFGRDPLGFLAQLSADFGSVARFRLGWQRAVLVTDPDDIERVLFADAAAVGKPPLVTRLGAPLFGRALTAADGDVWRRQRNLVAPAFTPRQFDRHAATIVRDAAAAVADWCQRSVRDVEAEARIMALRSLTRLFLSVELDAPAAAALGSEVQTILPALGKRIRRGLPIPLWLPTRENRAIVTGVRALHRRVAALMDAHDGDGGDDRSLLSVLRAAQADGGRLERRQLLDEVTVMLTLGAHQTALALSWTLEMVARHPEIQEALAKEAEAVEVETIRDDGWHRLVLARQVIEETLRLRPPFYVFARQTHSELRLSAHAIPAGTLVIVSPWLTHRDERYFAEPERFRPERWTPALRRARPRCAYLPFGAGPRVCLAQGLTTMYLTLSLAAIVRAASMTPGNREPARPQPELALGFAAPLALEFAPRNLAAGLRRPATALSATGR